jgi:hypothetical protein
MSEQSNSAAERSAYVIRGATEAPPEWPVVRLDDGRWQLKRVAELEAAIKDLAAHVWRGDWDKLKPETRAALGEKE